VCLGKNYITQICSFSPLLDRVGRLTTSCSNSVCLTDSTGAITSMGYAAIATRTSAAQGWVPIVPIRWQSSDLSILETHPLTPVPWPTATPGTPSLSGSRSSLSLGVIAGIAVAGAVIVLALMLAICFFIRRKRRTAAVSRSYMNTEVNVKGSDQDPTEMDTNAPKQKLVRSELPARRFSTGSHISLPRMYTAGPYQPELEATTITSKLPTSQSNEEGVVSPLVACPAGLYPSELATRSPQIPELPAQQRRQELPAVPEQWPLPPSSHTTNAYPSELAASPVLEIRPLTRASSKASELMRRQVQLQERRQRLAELEWIEQEEEAIQKRLAELS